MSAFDEKVCKFFDLKKGKEDFCPNCNNQGSVVFSLSNPPITGYKFSAMCKNCGYEEFSLEPDFVENWVLV